MLNINPSNHGTPISKTNAVQGTNNKPSQTESVPHEATHATENTPNDNANHQSIGSADTPPNAVQFGTQTEGTPQTKEEEIQELNALMTEGKEALSGFLQDPKNDEIETLGFIMEHAEQTLSAEDFATLSDRLFPKKPVIPDDATPKEKQDMLKAYDSNKKSRCDEKRTDEKY